LGGFELTLACWYCDCGGGTSMWYGGGVPVPTHGTLRLGFWPHRQRAYGHVVRWRPAIRALAKLLGVFWIFFLGIVLSKRYVPVVQRASRRTSAS
jgi:hypothetical protein